MAVQLKTRVLQDPSRNYSVLPPRPPSPDADGSACQPLDLVVGLRKQDSTLFMWAYRPMERGPKNGQYQADLTVSPDEALRLGGRLRTQWRERLVGYQPVNADGMPVGKPPFSEAVDLAAHAEVAVRRTDELAEEGRNMLRRLLAGENRGLPELRAFLLDALTGDEGLRVSFHSDLHLPWPMLAVDPPPGCDARHGFLGYRHQIEQTGTPAFASIQPEPEPRPRPNTSLNTDSSLDTVGRAPDVRTLLSERSQLTIRTRSDALLDDLAGAIVDEDLMYFWCHGASIENGTAHPHLGVKLSDGRTIDAELVRLKRDQHCDSTDALFRPFVLLNACHAGQAGTEPGLKHLGSALVDLGADGVLGPQIEIPQLFASEYAYAFLDRYLGGKGTAGEIALELVRRFVDSAHNPLALTYSLYCGIDSRLATAS